MKRFIFFCLMTSVTMLLVACQLSSDINRNRVSVADFFDYSEITDLSTHPFEPQILFTQTLPDEAPAVFSYSYVDESFTRHTQNDGITRHAIGFLPAKRKQERIVFSQTVADGGQHVFVKAGNSLVDLTPGRDVQAQFVGWGEFRRYLFLAIRYAGGDTQKVVRYRTDNFAASPVFDNKFDLPISMISQSGRYVAGVHITEDDRRRVYVADVSFPEPVYHWLPEKNRGQRNGEVTPLSFAPDGQALLFSAQTSDNSRQAYAWTIQNDVIEALPFVRGNVTAAQISSNQQVAIEYINDAKQYVSVFSQTGEQTFVSAANLNSWSARFLNVEGNETVVMMQGDDDIVASPVMESSEGTRRLPGKYQAPVDTVSAKPVTVSGFDGTPIPALLYRPNGADAKNSVPAVIYAHRGFDHVYTKKYHPGIQHLVASGYAVLAVNYRGSAGFGDRFRQLNDEKQGQDDTQDLIQAAGYLGTLDWVAANKIAVMGDNYGGFLALSAAMQSHAFRAVVDCFGITNWLTFLQSVPPWLPQYRNYLQHEFGDFEKSARRLYAISPAFHAQKINVPVFIAQGEQDPFVLLQQTDEFVATLKSSGNQVDYAVFNGQGHGVTRTHNRIILQQRIVAFLDRYLSDR